MYCASICLEGLSKSTKDLSENSRSPRPKFEIETFRIRSRSVNHPTKTFGDVIDEDGVVVLAHKAV
jgi:hypothetical protein